MNLSPLDVAIVCAYILLVFSIAVYANIFMKRRSLGRKRQKGITAIENHYLAGKSLSVWEISLSILATEFSAMAFIAIPSYVYFENLNYIKFVVGACISRVIISYFFLPHLYGKGLTIFEILARGIHSYPEITREDRQGKRVFSLIYISTKIVGVSLKLLGGATLIATFFDISLLFSILIISMMTYFYTILGGLKAVVRTDMLQAIIFVTGAFVAHAVIGNLTDNSWLELAKFGWESGKFKLFTSSSEALSFVFGIIAGFAYDAATHGVDQDMTQKLMGAKDQKIAQRALKISAVLSLLVNLLFLTLGVVVWSYYFKNGLDIPAVTEVFSNMIEKYFPSPMKGLMIAAILAACMSTLDSSINALSAVFWNDVMGADRAKLFKIYINLDNFIMTISIIIVAYLFSLLPEFHRAGSYFAYLSTAPLLAVFLARLLFEKWIKFNISPSLVLLSFGTSFLGISLNHFRFKLNPQLSILLGIVSTLVSLWFYSKVVQFLSPKKVENET